MRPVYNIEILLNEQNKMVYVYKIEQAEILRKNVDIRDVVDDRLQALYVNKHYEIVANIERKP